MEGGMARRWWSPTTIVLLVFGLFLGLYLYNITGWLKEDDEGTALYVTWRFAEGEIPYQELTTTKGPLFLLLGAGINGLLGPSILGLRVVTALAVIGSGYVWFCGLRAVYGLPASLIGAATFLLTPEIYHLGRLFRADSWMLILVACALSLGLIGYHSKHNRWLVLSGGLLGLAILTKVIAILPFLGCALFLALRVLLEKPRKERILGLAAFVVSYLIVAGTGFSLVEIAAPGALTMILGSQGPSAVNAPDWGYIVTRALVVYAGFIATNLILILGVPFIYLAIPSRKGVDAGLYLLCQLSTATAILILRGAVYMRYLAYTSLALSGLLAMGIYHILNQPGKRPRTAGVATLVLVSVVLSCFQLSRFLLRSEVGTRALATYIAESTAPDEVVLTDYAELAFHAQRRSVPQTGGIGYGWATAGLITGEELIQAIEQHHVSLVALHVPGGPENPGHLFYLQDWDTFYRYIQEHFLFETQMVRSGQLFEIYRRSTGG
jgi:4-amino-4-deoxy-L-arabinose transferase-like glycosyltransferase